MPYFRIRLQPLLVFSLLITAASTRPAYAETLGLDFSLPTSVHRLSPELTIPSPVYEPLAIPPEAISPPIQTQTKAAQLPPPPEILPSPHILLPVTKNSLPPQAAVDQLVGIPKPDPAWIFEGGADSLVARTIGSAEGTRTADGKLTPAYYGHVDPGNGVWNLGTFSYQHGAGSPEDADTQQLARLQHQSQILTHKATQHGVELSLVEKLNGLDLANQAPKAALEQDGYVERLAETRQMGIDGTDAILWARTQAYLDPDTKQWNAPGLGNNLHSIRRDQARRLSAINQSLAEYEKTQMTDQPSPTLFGELPLEKTSTLPERPSEEEPDETLFTDSNLDADNISFDLNKESKSQRHHLE
ncbi:MAG: hypothetical protein AAFN08_07840 [Cyanobacteria bacterium J06559_3]